MKKLSQGVGLSAQVVKYLSGTRIDEQSMVEFLGVLPGEVTFQVTQD
jgi:hypothetical protein